MNRGSGRDDAETDDEQPGRESQTDTEAEDLGARRKAAAYLRAAKLTDDAREREALRHKAAELLSPHRRASSGAGSRQSRKL